MTYINVNVSEPFTYIELSIVISSFVMTYFGIFGTVEKNLKYKKNPLFFTKSP